MPTAEFGSLSPALACIDTIQESIVSLVGDELIDALKRLDRAYDEFPELELDRPRGELLDRLQSTAENLPDRAAIPLLMYCIATSPSCTSSLTSLVEKTIKSDYHRLLSAVLCSLWPSREFCWRAIEPIIDALRQRSQIETVIQVISEVLGDEDFTTAESAAEFRGVLNRLLSDHHRLGIDKAVLAQTVRSARRRLIRPSQARSEPGSRAVLLAMAERLRSAPSPAPLSAYPDLGWPSSRMSFDAFLLQWPCEIELPYGLDYATFIEEAYREILLRGPDVAERNQYLRLLQDGIASKFWIIEDLLGSPELRSLDRRVRVICGGQVFTEPGRSPEEETPVVTWPCRSAG
jgi:hypothetical protein